ncbi:hypothetical protein SD37_11575 [Amycolatopsis orientalis]|uniref:Uncharacterized protein n=1 Tax=Amycolatopsis orientalis TaxID=31958 RepID=A0A193BVG8_AMYOR|nr:hypothetical protein [Amycolatopsis orientalis]ANN16217.1 hypothetical protein SD37_11575 [Amycolatopsis orientalis]
MTDQTHRDRAEMALSRAEDASASAPHHAAAFATIATAHAVLAHLDALALPEPGAGDAILAAARKLSNELPDFHARAFAEAVADTAFVGRDHGGATSGRDDHAQTHETPASFAPGVTNRRVPESLDRPAVSSRFSSEDFARLVGDLERALNVKPESIGETTGDQWFVDEFTVDCSTHTLLRVLARGLLATGWRPPLPDGGQDLAEQVAREIRNKLDWHQWPGCDWTNASLSDITDVALAAVMPFLDEPPVPRVFFPGDTVPAGMAVQGDAGDVHRSTASWPLDEAAGWDRPAVEIRSLTEAEWQAAVERARAERDQSTVEPEHADDCQGCDGPGIVPCAADRVIGNTAFRNGQPIKDLEAGRG